MNELETGAGFSVESIPAHKHVSKSVSFTQRAVLAAFEKMTEGELRLTLPDGSTRIFGSPDSEITAAMRVRHPAFFTKCLLYGDIGFAESYMDGDWETASIRDVIAWAILNVEKPAAAGGSSMRSLALNFLQFANRLRHLLRPNTRRTSRKNIEAHYDLGNDFYRLWLDPTMTYSSARFTAQDQSLESAQAAKYEALCQQLRCRPGDHLLEIGCGWGGFASHAAREHGCHVTGITISPAQHHFATARIQREGLAGLVSIELCDYRELTGTYNKIVSIEMMEALGDRYLPIFCAQLDRLLSPRGLAALQFITVPDARHRELRRGVDFIQKHIFPGSLLLSVGRVNEMMNRTGDLFLHHLEDLGAGYARTLHQWWQNFNAQEPAVRALGFDTRFIRKWNYYLQYCEAAFAMRNVSVVQAVYTRPNNPILRTL
jgi:cyclopropane-fatty-acyl-phospholipid synthase